MSEALLAAGWFLAALALMEPVAYLSHRFLMHGPLWPLHRSHHQPPTGGVEKNDLFALFFSLPSMLLIWLGLDGHPGSLWAGLGVAAYGLAYFLFHDLLVHHRLRHRYRPRSPYLRRLVHAHRLHHASRNRRGNVSYGFLLAPPVHRLRARMRVLEARGYVFDAYGSRSPA